MKHHYDFLNIYKAFNLMSKLNIMLLSSALGVIWARNILSMHIVNYLFYIFTTCLVLTLQSKMMLLKGNVGTLLKLLVLFYYLHVFLLNFEGKP